VGELPAGTVTFLFTDVEGSTRLLHELGDAYADVLGEHRRVLRECFDRHGGVEVGLVQGHELGFRGGTLYCFLVLAGVALLEQHFERAVTLVGVADALSEELGQTLERNESQIREDVVFSARAALGENVFATRYAEGSALEIDAGVSYALAAVD
jgi:class 3 adenylate cyclase